MNYCIVHVLNKLYYYYQEKVAQSRLDALRYILQLFTRNTDVAGAESRENIEQRHCSESIETSSVFCGGLLPSVYHEILSSCFSLENMWTAPHKFPQLAENEVSSVTEAETWSWQGNHYLDGIRCCSAKMQKEITSSAHQIFRLLIASLRSQKSEKDLGDRLSLVTVLSLSVRFSWQDLMLVVSENLLQALHTLAMPLSVRESICMQTSTSRSLGLCGSPVHILPVAAQTLLNVIACLCVTQSDKLQDHVRRCISDCFHDQIQCLAENIIASNESSTQLLMMKAQESAGRRVIESTTEEELSSGSSRSNSEEEEELLMSSEGAGAACAGSDNDSVRAKGDSRRRKLMLKLPRLKLDSDHSYEDELEKFTEVKHLEISLGNLMIFARRLCSDTKLGKEMGTTKWIDLLLRIMTHNATTNLAHVHSLRTRIIANQLLKFIASEESILLSHMGPPKSAKNP